LSFFLFPSGIVNFFYTFLIVFLLLFGGSLDDLVIQCVSSQLIHLYSGCNWIEDYWDVLFFGGFFLYIVTLRFLTWQSWLWHLTSQ